MALLSFAKPIGLLALLSLIPLIILYLIRSKPKKFDITSLMFLMKDKGHIQKLSFLQKFFRNILFFIQLLILLLLAVSIAAPIINVPYDATSQNTIIVIDGSGSMNTKTGIMSRFDKAITKARNELSGTITIILAQEIPFVVLEEGTKSDANDVLSKLVPKATKTNLQDSMIFALESLKGERGKVVVISDFVTSKLDDISLAQRTIASRGSKVKFINVKEKEHGKGNIGIINLDVDKKQTKVFVKNYKDNEVTVDIIVEKENQQLDKKPTKILPHSIETITFETVPGISKVRINVNDDLELDNIAYLSSPEKKEISALLITSEDSTSLQFALESSPNIKLEKIGLPVVPSFSHDVMILHKFDKKLWLPGTFEDISRYVKKGGVFILTTQDDLHEVDMSGLDLVKLNNKNKDSVACIDTINEITKHFSNNRCFAHVSNYYKFEKPKDSVSIASAEDGTPLILIKGNIVFYNIDDDHSDFNRLPIYPIFWDSLLRYMVGEENIQELNVPTGTIRLIDQQDVKTPSGVVNVNRIVMDQEGIYKYSGKAIAANMVDEQESDIYNSDFNLEEQENQMGIKAIKAREEFNLENQIIILSLLLIIFELIYIKMRGDI